MFESKPKEAFLAAEHDVPGADMAFLQLVHTDVAKNPEGIQPIPSSLLSRVAYLRSKAQANREGAGLLESRDVDVHSL